MIDPTMQDCVCLPGFGWGIVVRYCFGFDSILSVFDQTPKQLELVVVLADFP